MDNITNLPNEIFVQLMKDLSYDDLQILTQVSRSNYGRIQSEAKRMLSRKYPDFLQFYDGRKSYLYYLKTIDQVDQEQKRYSFYSQEGLFLAFNTENLPISTFFINRYIEDLNGPIKYVLYEGDMSIPEVIYNQIAIEILNSPNITIEILEYIKNLYPGVFNEIEVPQMDNWQIVGTHLYNPATMTVVQMYTETGADKWLVPGNPIFEWLRENSNWIESNPEWLIL